MASKDHEPRTNESSGEARPDKGFDARRRRLTQGIAGGLPIVMTLSQRPVWGAVDCSPSAVASANSSLNPGWETCEFGCSPGYWKPTGQDNRPDEIGWVRAWNETGVTTETSFARVFRLYNTLTMAELPDWESLTLGNALEQDSGILSHLHQQVKVCAFHATAAYLNASHPVLRPAFRYNAEYVIGEFQTGLRHYLDTNDKSYLQTLKDELDEANNQTCVLSARNYNAGAV